MIMLYPLLLLVAGILAVRRRELADARGARWLAAWAAAGALFTFSFLTGLSIGLLVLPAAAAALLAVAWSAPHAAEVAGFVVGVGAMLMLVAAIGHPGFEWAVAGAATAIAGIALSLLARRRAQSVGPPAGYA